jgi:hypothetical protein
MKRLYPIGAALLFALSVTGFSFNTDAVETSESSFANGTTLAVVCHYPGHEGDTGRIVLNKKSKHGHYSYGDYVQRVQDIADQTSCKPRKGSNGDGHVIVIPVGAAKGGHGAYLGRQLPMPHTKG